MQSPRTQKEAQRLTGRITALTWFISCAGDRSLLFSKATKKGKEFEWTPEFSESTLSSVLIQEEEKIQRLVYYVIWVMRGPRQDTIDEKIEYGILLDSTTVEWVAEEAFRMKESRGPSRRSPSRQQNPKVEFEVYSARRGPLSDIFLGPIAEMRHLKGGSCGDRGDARGNVLKPHQWKSPNGFDIVGDFQRTHGDKRFGVPRVPVKDDGSQFTAGKIKDLCLELDIEHQTASVSYPQTNGQVEVRNRVIFKGVKKGLQEERDRLEQELRTVLWLFRTTLNPITGETPFSLVYGSDALLPVEIYLETAQVSYYDELANEQGLRLNLDLLEGKRAATVDKMARYKEKESAHRKPGKLESPMEGPYIVLRVVGPVTYELKTLEGHQVSRSWNTCHLRKYYV
ncbi:hypothetical protein LIER_15602 [Lithospermum erythrorhizon]|uniref:Integrase catalytic domain-containing protein n=1 Tax=Lithospermum erythrorhizon TaxID=34254 RepID=A0AAV3Q522_LITER